jgi:uncharacterized protein
MFTTVIKPTHICNLSCNYCFNDDERKPVMSFDTLARVVQETFAYATKTKQTEINFVWHGGEPTVVGINFYRKAIQFQAEFSTGIKYENLFQTNAILINDNWVKFIKEQRFQLSISIDGEEIHNDKYRVNVNGEGSFKKIIRAMDLLSAADVSFGACLTLHKGNIADVKNIYAFLAKRGLGFHLVPLMKSGLARDRYDEIGLTENEYGDAWIEMYDSWFDASPTYTYVTDFVERTEAVLRGDATSCWTSSNCCDNNVTIDPEGNVYSCASLSGTPIALYGNINNKSFEALFASRNALYWRTRQHSEQCISCKWFHVCHGGCMARSYKFFSDIDAPDYYCDSLFRIYEHIEKRLKEKNIAIARPNANHMRSQLPLDTRAKLNFFSKKSSLSSIPVRIIR